MRIFDIAKKKQNSSIDQSVSLPLNIHVMQFTTGRINKLCHDFILVFQKHLLASASW
jgi:hypothetical protein